jgi:hypothetical protein
MAIMHDYAAGVAYGWMPVDLYNNPGMNVLGGVVAFELILRHREHFHIQRRI